ncbi:hypothetical protein [Wenxinia marina]|uniref:hypothetical protein n=1 Tax=Wenxinia marina TaxID=390641 RepID=UPI000378446A|nr:hypothetical protein [Wenxinia marina]GGL78792.1 hypothetical protein GCM10011392_36580 [Wenxinia marina]
MTRLTLHVGTPKAGTSALQNFLHEMRADLNERHGFLYPATGVSPGAVGARHIALCKALAAEDGAEMLKDMVTETELAGARHVLLSFEGVYRGRSLDRIVARLRPHFEVDILVYIRHPLDFVESLWREQVRRRGEWRDLDQVFDDHVQFARYDRAHAQHVALVGEDGVSVRSYEASTGQPGGIIGDLLTGFLGLSAEEAGSLIAAHLEGGGGANESVSDRLILAHLLNNRRAAAAAPALDRHRLEELAPALPDDVGEGRLCSRGQMRQIDRLLLPIYLELLDLGPEAAPVSKFGARPFNHAFFDPGIRAGMERILDEATGGPVRPAGERPGAAQDGPMERAGTAHGTGHGTGDGDVDAAWDATGARNADEDGAGIAARPFETDRVETVPPRPMHEAADTVTMPAAEYDCLVEAYRDAGVILEYGSGHSTVMASRLPDKLVFSVESDRDWAMRLQARIDAEAPPSPAVVYHVDIGETGDWGRPKSDRAWHRFHHYPNRIWDEPFFRHPDLVLIDGRFRAACFATICLRITRPVRLLFDDYTTRPVYQDVERLAEPVRFVGRMAEFHLQPGLARLPEDLSFVLGLYAQATYDDGTRTSYG